MPLPEPDSHHLLPLSDQQRTLLKALEARDRNIAVIYLGGLYVLADTKNPDRFALCAHAIREMMEKLPEYLNVSMPAHSENLKAKVRELVDAWPAERDDPAPGDSRESAGGIDDRLGKFIQKAREFIAWFREHHPRRREEVHHVLRRMDGSGRSLPEPLADLNVKAWFEIRDFFVAVAHHRRDGAAMAQVFSEWLDALERFLLDRLLPRTFDDFAKIDALLGGGPDADP